MFEEQSETKKCKVSGLRRLLAYIFTFKDKQDARKIAAFDVFLVSICFEKM